MYPEGEFKTALLSRGKAKFTVVCSRSTQNFNLVISRYSCARNDKELS